MTKRERKALAKKVREAAAYVDRVGLHKGNLYDARELREKVTTVTGSWTKAAVQNDVPCCTIGVMDGFGIDKVGPARPGHYVTDELAKFLAKKHPRAEIIDVDDDGVRYADIPEWNDKPSRRKKDVVELLTAFSDHLEEGS